MSDGLKLSRPKLQDLKMAIAFYPELCWADWYDVRPHCVAIQGTGKLLWLGFVVLPITDSRETQKAVKHEVAGEIYAFHVAAG